MSNENFWWFFKHMKSFRSIINYTVLFVKLKTADLEKISMVLWQEKMSEMNTPLSFNHFALEVFRKNERKRLYFYK